MILCPSSLIRPLWGFVLVGYYIMDGVQINKLLPSMAREIISIISGHLQILWKMNQIQSTIAAESGEQ